MDLNAYMNIHVLAEIAEANGINIPRLRGYRYMKGEKPYTDEEIQNNIDDEIGYNYRSLEDISARMMEDAINHDIRKFECDLSWIDMHARTIRSYEKEFRAQAEMWNKYAGRDDVLYIHSRMGNIKYPIYDDNGKKVATQDYSKMPWFLDWCRDAYDGTYIDIYAKIKPIEKTD